MKFPTNIATQELETVGGFNLPLWKMMDFVKWEDYDEIPNMMGKS
jgi:hypothetical protein